MIDLAARFILITGLMFLLCHMFDNLVLPYFNKPQESPNDVR